MISPGVLRSPSMKNTSRMYTPLRFLREHVPTREVPHEVVGRRGPELHFVACGCHLIGRGEHALGVGEVEHHATLLFTRRLHSGDLPDLIERLGAVAQFQRFRLARDFVACDEPYASDLCGLSLLHLQDRVRTTSCSGAIRVAVALERHVLHIAAFVTSAFVAQALALATLPAFG